ncbi:hypothetical protein KQX54_011176 [Cotesia glomerata]|uniref:Uncharacterized protein n=1 Tax=Cotesia glomerata TaxID=32391 RepID=A0AAV7IL96_COTGL|nr:hypothetical protein KQX54_011176 [Cotesia glomerata]
MSKRYTRTCTKVSKEAITRRPPTTTNKPASSSIYVKTRVFTKSQPPAATPRRRSVSPVPAPARTPPVASTSTFKLPECLSHLSPAFTAYRASQYKEALERATRTGVLETGTPRAEKLSWPEPTNVPVRRKTGKKKKKRIKGELRGPNWAAMEFGGSGKPVSEDSGMEDERIFNDLDESDNDVLQLDHGEDL